MILVNIRPRFIAASLFCSFIVFTRVHIAIKALHPVVDVDVVHCLAVSIGHYSSACHVLLVRRDGANLRVGSTGRAESSSRP